MTYHNSITKLVIYVFLSFLALLSIYPFWMTFVNATRDSYSIQQGFSVLPGKELVNNYEKLIAKGSFDVWRGMFNSLIVAVTVTVLAVYFSTLTAYGLTAYTFKLRDAAFSIILGVLMVPTQVSAVGFYQFIYKLHMNNTYWPLILPAIASPAVVFFMRQYMKTVVPLEIVEAARIDGSGEFATFNRFILPIVKSGMAIQAIFTFIGTWNNFFTPSMILSDKDKYTLPVMIQMLKSDRFRTDYGLVYLGIAMSIIPLIIVYACLSKYIIAGATLGGVKE